MRDACELMERFAERTGLTSERPKRRYLWTDAFAVCNFLGLAQVTGESRYTDLALRLVDQVHHVLGAHRADDPRTGWISGLSKGEGEAHPTQGGLRIGKELPERGIADSFDEQLEWQRDGQYFHYLTKWMHALDQVYRWAGQSQFHTWARELAKAAHDAFAYGEPGRRRMVWKMSTDLSRPLVSTMGQHDPLDGLVTYTQLQTPTPTASRAPNGLDLEDATLDFAGMLAVESLATADPLGLGGLLMDAARVAQLRALGASTDDDLLAALLEAALRGLEHYARQNDSRQPASRRLGFRELGLAIGLAAIELIEHESTAGQGELSRKREVRRLVRALAPYRALGAAIESFWLHPEHQRVPTWREHRDINEVMLATRLVPDGFLLLPKEPGGSSLVAPT